MGGTKMLSKRDEELKRREEDARLQLSQANINKSLDAIIKERMAKRKRDEADLAATNRVHFDDEDEEEGLPNTSQHFIAKNKAREAREAREAHEADEEEDDTPLPPRTRTFIESTITRIMHPLISRFTATKKDNEDLELISPTLNCGGKGGDLSIFETYPNDIIKLSNKARKNISIMKQNVLSTQRLDLKDLDDIMEPIAAISRLSVLQIRSMYMAANSQQFTQHLGHAVAMSASCYKDKAPLTKRTPDEEKKMWPEEPDLRAPFTNEEKRTYASQAAAAIGSSYNSYSYHNRGHRGQHKSGGYNTPTQFPFGSNYDISQGGMIPAPPPRTHNGGAFPVRINYGQRR
jgi:hypothetical protein